VSSSHPTGGSLPDRPVSEALADAMGPRIQFREPPFGRWTRSRERRGGLRRARALDGTRRRGFRCGAALTGGLRWALD